MPRMHETRGAKRSRAPVLSAVAADTLENTETLAFIQAKWLSRRLGLTAERAKLVAEMAFQGRPAS